MSLAAALAPLLAGRRVLCLRHGNTGKAETDAARQLTEKGIAQCEAFRTQYAASLAGVTNCAASPVRFIPSAINSRSLLTLTTVGSFSAKNGRSRAPWPRPSWSSPARTGSRKCTRSLSLLVIYASFLTAACDSRPNPIEELCLLRGTNSP